MTHVLDAPVYFEAKFDMIFCVLSHEFAAAIILCRNRTWKTDAVADEFSIVILRRPAAVLPTAVAAAAVRRAAVYCLPQLVGGVAAAGGDFYGPRSE
jgi:hypothetical protein